MAVTAALPLPMAKYTSPLFGIAMSPPKPDASTVMFFQPWAIEAPVHFHLNFGKRWKQTE